MVGIFTILGLKVEIFSSCHCHAMCQTQVITTTTTTTTKSLQSCLTLCDPMHYSLPGSTVPEILQARTLEWVAISFSNA